MGFQAINRVELAFTEVPLRLLGGKAATETEPGTAIVEILEAVGSEVAAAAVEVDESVLLAAILQYSKDRGIRQKRRRAPRRTKAEMESAKAKASKAA